VQPTTPEAGMGEHLRSLLASVAAYFRARLQLAGLESREALSHYLKIGGFLAGALTGFFFGYIFLCISIALILSHCTGLRLMWAVFALAAVHFLLAAVCGFFVVKRISSPMFRATIAEFKKDHQWLNNPKPS
jgi:uncharacterized membrane protein YqjE